MQAGLCWAPGTQGRGGLLPHDVFTPAPLGFRASQGLQWNPGKMLTSRCTKSPHFCCETSGCPSFPSGVHFQVLKDLSGGETPWSGGGRAGQASEQEEKEVCVCRDGAPKVGLRVLARAGLHPHSSPRGTPPPAGAYQSPTLPQAGQPCQESGGLVRLKSLR